jgi:hypothetical protein
MRFYNMNSLTLFNVNFNRILLTATNIESIYVIDSYFGHQTSIDSDLDKSGRPMTFGNIGRICLSKTAYISTTLSYELVVRFLF